MNHEFREFREFTRTAEKKTRFCHKQPFTNLARIQISKLSVSRAQSRQERADVINSQWVPLIGANTRAIDFEGYCNSDDAADANFQEFHSSTCSVYILSNAISQQYPAPSHAGGKQTKFRRLFFPCAIFLTSMMNS
jgi:hypothetical protein